MNTINPLVIDWLKVNAPTNEFAASLNSWWLRKGALSEKQVAAVERIIARNVEQVQNAPTVDIKEIEDRFNYAKARGVSKPMLRLGVYKFKPASMTGNNAGAIWVTEAEKNIDGEARYLGKIKGGKFFPSRDCTREDEEDILQVAANPSEAARAYGQRTGNCCVCGRLLTKEESIDRMIGPICAGRYGF